MLKTVNSIKTSSNNNECYLNLETWEEELTPVQLAQQQKADQEYNDITDKLEQMSKQSDAELIHEGEVCTALELANITGKSFFILQIISLLLNNVIYFCFYTNICYAAFLMSVDRGEFIYYVTPVALVDNCNFKASLQCSTTGSMQAFAEPDST